jgi:hypothetical protein
MFKISHDRVYGHGHLYGHAAGAMTEVDTVRQAEKIIKKDEREKEKSKAVSEKLTRLGLTVGTTLAFGLLEGYRQTTDAKGQPVSGVPAIAGIGADVITGVVLHGLSLTGYIKGEKTEAMVDAIANGALAFAAATYGTSWGHDLKKKMDEKAKGSGTTTGHFLDQGREEFTTGESVYANQFR